MLANRNVLHAAGSLQVSLAALIVLVLAAGVAASVARGRGTSGEMRSSRRPGR